MSKVYTEAEVIVSVTRLTRRQLVRFIDDAFIKPERGEGGYVFRPIDVARLELLCDLHHDLDLDEAALGIVISLVDQLHGARQDLAAMAEAINVLPADMRADILAAIKPS